MGSYLLDSERHIVGIVEEVRGRRMLYTEKGHDVLGYYDENANLTCDAYGSAIGEGDMLLDLPYFPHRLRFPLPEPSRVKFSTYRIQISNTDGKKEIIQIHIGMMENVIYAVNMVTHVACRDFRECVNLAIGCFFYIVKMILLIWKESQLEHQSQRRK